MEITQSKYRSKQIGRAAVLEICQKQEKFSFGQVIPSLIEHLVDPVFYDAIERVVLEPFLKQGLIEETEETETHNNKLYTIYKSRVFKSNQIGFLYNKGVWFDLLIYRNQGVGLKFSRPDYP